MIIKYNKKIVNKFWDRVDKSGDCWLWTRYLNDRGYGHFTYGYGKTVKAHRFSYELNKGKIPKDKEIDHLCRNRACVNPGHLEAVSHQENCARGFGPGSPRTHCKYEHACGLQYNYGKSQRTCRTCYIIAGRKRRAENRLLVAALV